MTLSRYEHLVEINDPALTLVARLSREQIWQGLLARAYTPKLFVFGLENYTVEDISGAAQGQLQRMLDYGTFRIHDRVLLDPGQRMITDVAAGPTWPPSRLTIAIEEPQPDQLFLRFVYEWEESAAEAADEMARNFRENAYYAADLDTVTKIRELALQ